MKRRILFISLNSISAIPVFRLILSGWESSFFSRITLIECFLEDLSTRFDIHYEHYDILHFKNTKNFNNQNLLQKIRKYFQVIKYLFKYVQSNSILYTCDVEVLALGIWIKRLKKSSCLVIYHQFETIEWGLASAAKRYALNYLRSAPGVDLAIFPEQNRLVLFCDLINLPRSKTFLFPNTCHSKEDDIIQRSSDKRLRIGYIGNLSSESFFLDELLNAIRLINQRNFQFIFVGVKDKHIEEKIKINIPDAEVTGWVDHSSLGNIYSTLDIGLILYKPLDFNTDYCAPNKLYEYWSYGVPVIAPKLKGLIPIFDSVLKGELIDFVNLSQVIHVFENCISCENRQFNRMELIKVFRKNLALNVYLKQLQLKLNELV